MKSVKKAIKKKFPRYNLRSRAAETEEEIYFVPVSIAPKVSKTIQCDLSDEENCELSKELPFLLSYGDLLKPINEVDCSESETEEPEQRLSTAFTSPEQANVTQREPIDISIEPNGDSLIQLSVAGIENSHKQPIPPEVGPEKFQPSQSSSPSCLPHYSPACATSRVEDSAETDDESEELEFSKKTPRVTQIPVINSPADLIKLVNPRPASREDDTSDSDYLPSLIDEVTSGEISETDSTEENQAEHSQEETNRYSMSAELLKDLKDQVTHLQTQLQLQQIQQQKTTSALEKAPIPESSSMHRPAPFHGYDSEDVCRWLDKIESYLKLRRIDPASPTALAELSLNLAGPAEDFYSVFLA